MDITSIIAAIPLFDGLTQKQCESLGAIAVRRTFSIELDISKNQMAGLLGTIPETISRILKRMNEEKLIKVSTRLISLLDKKGLADLAQGVRRLA